MKARYYYIQNTVNPQDPAPVGQWGQLNIEGIPPKFVIWKGYSNDNPTAKDQGMNKAAFKGWLNDNKVNK